MNRKAILESLVDAVEPELEFEEVVGGGARLSMNQELAHAVADALCEGYVSAEMPIEDLTVEIALRVDGYDWPEHTYFSGQHQDFAKIDTEALKFVKEELKVE